MTREQIIQYLLNYAGDSIKYRLNRDILHVPADTTEMIPLQKSILNAPKVKKLLQNQHEDGWFGNELHGGSPPGVDVSVTALLSLGLDKNHSAFKKLINCLLNPTNSDNYRRWFRGGYSLDEDGRGGNKAVIAGCLAQLNEEDNPIVKEQIDLSLKHFKGALEHKDISDFAVKTKSGVLYYKKNALFPGANHIYLLSKTNSWRTRSNLDLVRKSFGHCFNLMKDEISAPTFKSGSHFVGPFNYDWHICDFQIDDVMQDSYAFVWWLRTLYQSSTLCLIKDIPPLYNSFSYLEELFYSGDIYKKQTTLSKKRFKDIWSLETSWRKDKSMICDFVFSGLITLNNAGL